MTLRSFHHQIDNHGRNAGERSVVAAGCRGYRPADGRTLQSGIPTLFDVVTSRKLGGRSGVRHLSLNGSNDLYSLTAGGRSRRNGCALGRQTGVGAVPLCGVHSCSAIRFTGQLIPIAGSCCPRAFQRRRLDWSFSHCRAAVQSQRTTLCGALSLQQNLACQGSDLFEGHSVELHSSSFGCYVPRHSDGAIAVAQEPGPSGAKSV